jgi:hypothetical protein
MDTIKNYKYKIIKNFLCVEEINLLQIYCDIKHLNNLSNFDNQFSKTGDTFFYGDPLMESLMANKISLMEKETNLYLFPTYSYWRMYTYGADLPPHKDRESCEISVTVQINGDSQWPIYINGKPIILKNGDAVAYCGTELLHYRNPLESDFHAQAFLHYVDQNGPYKDHRFDRRTLFGRG